MVVAFFAKARPRWVRSISTNISNEIGLTRSWLIVLYIYLLKSTITFYKTLLIKYRLILWEDVLPIGKKCRLYLQISLIGTLDRTHTMWKKNNNQMTWSFSKNICKSDSPLYLKRHHMTGTKLRQNKHQLTHICSWFTSFATILLAYFLNRKNWTDSLWKRVWVVWLAPLSCHPNLVQAEPELIELRLGHHLTLQLRLVSVWAYEKRQ